MSRSLAMAKNGSSLGLVRGRVFLAWDFLWYFLFPIEKKVRTGRIQK
ncbi:hypothetical protein [Flavipsychrobacter stenotrophus]|nr:hypothetical protein [Flavipsychrobacter stenotrophus]